MSEAGEVKVEKGWAGIAMAREVTGAVTGATTIIVLSTEIAGGTVLSASTENIGSWVWIMGGGTDATWMFSTEEQ